MKDCQYVIAIYDFLRNEVSSYGIFLCFKVKERSFEIHLTLPSHKNIGSGKICYEKYTLEAIKVSLYKIAIYNFLVN